MHLRKTTTKILPMRTLVSCLLAVVFSLSAFGQSAKKFFKTGEEFFKAAKYQDAINQFTSAVAINPEYKDAYFMRGVSYEMIKDFSKAADDFNRALIFEPKNEELCYHIGKSYYELKKYKEALDILNKATFLNRKYMPAYQEKILVLVALDQSFNAIKVSDTALALDGNAYNYYLQGLVNENLNSTQKSEWAYTKAIKEDKKYIDAYVALANLQLTLNKTEEAMLKCNEALKWILTRGRLYLRGVKYS